MSTAQQTIQPGRLEAAFRAELEVLARRAAIEKIWAKQPDLWKSDDAHVRVIRNRLGWLDVLAPMRAEIDALHAFASDARAAGFADVVLLGMGGSSLAPEVFSLTFPAPAGTHFFVLDSTDPASVLTVERAVDLRRTLFIVASKSGKTVETLSQFRYFLCRLEAAGVSPPGANFIAITDAGSSLDQLAAEQRFRHVFRNPADIGGRYSALSFFGLVPAALCGVPIAAVLDSAQQMADACGPRAASDTNPALALGTLLGAAARHGADKVFLFATPSLAPLGNWIEQLVAESTGKEGKGVIPIANEVPGPPEVFGEDCIAVSFSLSGDDRASLDALATTLAARGTPLIQIHFTERAELGGEFFKWELATAVAGVVLEVNPFDEPNVQEAKDLTAAVLDQFQRTATMSAGRARAARDGVELFFGDALAKRVAATDIAPALRRFFALRGPGDYLALLAFLDRSAADERRLQQLRILLRDLLKMPVLAGFGPRYLHSIGQLYKGGPASGMFIEITAADSEDAAVPGARYTFGQLKLAQALGDFQALERHAKPAIRLHLSRGADAGLSALRALFEDSLR